MQYFAVLVVGAHRQHRTCLIVDPDEALWTNSGRISHRDRQWHLPLEAAEGRAMSVMVGGIGLSFIAWVIRWRDIRKRVMVSDDRSTSVSRRRIQRHRLCYGERGEESESVIAAAVSKHQSGGRGWGLLSSSESRTGWMCCLVKMVSLMIFTF